MATLKKTRQRRLQCRPRPRIPFNHKSIGSPRTLSRPSSAPRSRGCPGRRTRNSGFGTAMESLRAFSETNASPTTQEVQHLRSMRIGKKSSGVLIGLGVLDRNSFEQLPKHQLFSGQTCSITMSLGAFLSLSGWDYAIGWWCVLWSMPFCGFVQVGVISPQFSGMNRKLVF